MSSPEGHQSSNKPQPPVKEKEPGEGLRSIRTTGVFRAVNFELYARPNKVVMAVGVLAISLCVGYLAYMRTRFENIPYYVAVAEDGTKTARIKKTTWD